jgi:diguanylate cyclase (GGDEF)-like protein
MRHGYIRDLQNDRSQFQSQLHLECIWKSSSPKEMFVIESSRRTSDKTKDREFRDTLRVVDRTTSRLLWTSLLMILLVPAVIVVLSLSFQLTSLGPLPAFSAGQLARGLLVLLWFVIVSSVAFQRKLRVLRTQLIDQMEAAAKQRLKAERYYELSILDPLTGLYNRRFGATRLQEEIERAEKSGDPLLVLALDFDRFKEINDNYGHAAGDLALKAFSRRMQRAIRACDVPIRVGGDEFLLILPECSMDKVDTILSRMQPIEVKVDGQRFPVCFSSGAALYQANDTPETIIKRADEQLYAEKAKRPGVHANRNAEGVKLKRSSDAASESDLNQESHDFAGEQLGPASAYAADPGMQAEIISLGSSPNDSKRSAKLTAVAEVPPEALGVQGPPRSP